MGHSANLCGTPWEKICEKNEKPPERGNPPESTHYVIAHFNVAIEELFSTSNSILTDTWLLDTRATYHMTFRRDFF